MVAKFLSMSQDFVKQESIQRGVNINFSSIFPLAKPEEGWFGQPKSGTQIHIIITWSGVVAHFAG